MSFDHLAQAADALGSAFRSHCLLDKLPEGSEPATLAEAYALQAMFAERRGAALAGWKIGMANPAAQKARGMDHPVYGMLFSDSNMPSPGKAYGGWARQMMEAEFVFELARDLPARPDYPLGEIRDAIGAVYPGIEACGSRLRLTELPLTTSLADNSNHNALILGDAIDDWRSYDLALAEPVVEVSGSSPVRGSGRNVMGDPINTLHWLSGIALPCGGLRKGHLIASGACTAAITGPGPFEVRANFGLFGIVTVSISAPDGGEVHAPPGGRR